jgi:nicotinamide-nucleotide amidase
MNRATLVRNFIDLLLEKKLTLALAESMTCGLAAHQLSTCKGTSEVLMGSVVTYSENMKIETLGIRRRKIKKYSAESPEVTVAMARKLRKLVNADVYAAVTGLASPGGSETAEKPVGTVFYAVIIRGKLFESRKRFRGTPLQIRQRSVIALYQTISGLVGRHEK